MTFNHDGRGYELGTALRTVGVDDLDGTLPLLAEQDIEPERASPTGCATGGPRIWFIQDPDE